MSLRNLNFKRFSSSGSDKPELDFRPPSKNHVPKQDLMPIEKLAEVEKNRISRGLGGAVVGQVEWITIDGNVQKAVFRPASVKPTNTNQATQPGSDTNRAGNEEGEDDEKEYEARALHAKRVIEEAIEIERQALERKLYVKKN